MVANSPCSTNFLHRVLAFQLSFSLLRAQVFPSEPSPRILTPFSVLSTWICFTRITVLLLEVWRPAFCKHHAFHTFEWFRRSPLNKTFLFFMSSANARIHIRLSIFAASGAKVRSRQCTWGHSTAWLSLAFPRREIKHNRNSLLALLIPANKAQCLLDNKYLISEWLLLYEYEIKARWEYIEKYKTLPLFANHTSSIKTRFH